MKKLFISIFIVLIPISLLILSISKHGSVSGNSSIPALSSENGVVSPGPPIVAPENSEELREKRSRNSKVFKNEDGTETAVFTRNPIHYKSPEGELKDIDLAFRRVDDAYISDKNTVKTTVTNNELALYSPSKKTGITWIAPTPMRVEKNIAMYTDENGLLWKYRTTPAGVKLETIVSERLGKKTFTFPYKVDPSVTLTVNKVTGEILGDGFRVRRSFAVGKNNQIIEASAWVINNDSTVSFNFDDSDFPNEAFPYLLDPSTTFLGDTGDGVVACAATAQYHAFGFCIGGSAANSTNTTFAVGQDCGSALCDSNSGMITVSEGFLKFDTSSIDDSAIIYNARLVMIARTMAVDSNVHFQVNAAIYDWAEPLSTSSFRSRSELNSLSPVASLPTSEIVAGSSDNYFSSVGSELSTNINKTGATKLVLWSSRFQNGDYPTSTNVDEIINFASANYPGTASDPRLEITYTTEAANTFQLEGLRLNGIRAN